MDDVELTKGDLFTVDRPTSLNEIILRLKTTYTDYSSFSVLWLTETLERDDLPSIHEALHQKVHTAHCQQTPEQMERKYHDVISSVYGGNEYILICSTLRVVLK